MDSNGYLPQTDPVTASLVTSNKTQFFSGKENLDLLKENLMTLAEPSDGDFGGVWILTMVDHWNNNIEKVVLMTEKSLFEIRYDFVTKNVVDSRKVVLADVLEVKTGELVYPQYSMMGSRGNSGVEIVWGDLAAVTWTQRWNPLCRTIPSVVFVNHPLFYSRRPQTADPAKSMGGPASATMTPELSDDADRERYSVEGLRCTLQAAIGEAKIKSDNITIYSYGNISSVVFNQSALGFNKERHGVSF